MVKNYEKPVVLANDELAEGIYAASGEVVDNTPPDVDTTPSEPAEGNSASSDNGPKCDSIYMKGVWQDQNRTTWAPGETKSYKEQFGCLGCRAYTADGCGLLTHYVESGYASSYDDDNGNRKPGWEKKGYGPDDPITDWDVGN